MNFTVIAGPCAVESQEQINTIAKVVAQYPNTILKGGGYKPLTWGPGHRKAYQKSLGEYGIGLLQYAAIAHHLNCVSEDWFPTSTALRVQIGARNMQNFALLEHINKFQAPVLLKRHFGCTSEEIYASTTYLPDCDVWVCERGIRAFDTHGYRFLIDYQNVAEWVRVHPTIPIFVDVSHWIGVEKAKWLSTKFEPQLYEVIKSATLMSKAAGASGVVMDIHPTPESAWVDPYQCLNMGQFQRLMGDLDGEDGEDSELDRMRQIVGTS